MSFVGQIDAVTNKSSNGESYHQLIDSDLSESEINTNITSKNSRFAEIPVRTNTIFEYICEKLCFLRDQILLKIDRNYLLYKQTLDFARSEIKNHPDVAPIIFQKQPVNQEIAILTTLYWDKYRTEFSQVLKKHKKNAWKEDEVIQSADRLMKVAYAISILTLEDLFKFCIKNGSFGYARTLTRQDSYQYRTFFYCSQIYHHVRGKLMCINKEKKIKDGDEPAEYLGYKSKKISSSFSTPFYKSGTIQNQWNKLYNDYCDRIRSYVSESSLRSADTRFVNWTRKDLDENSFIRTPDTLPT